MSGKVVCLQDVQRDSGFRIDGLRPLIPPGVYKLGFTGHYTAKYFKSSKLVLQFKVLDMGKYFETPLERFYNVKKINGKPARGGRFTVSASSDFIQEYCSVCFGRVNRLDRISMDPLRKIVVLGKVETVSKNHKQKDKPELLQYSVIRELLKADS